MATSAPFAMSWENSEDEPKAVPIATLHEPVEDDILPRENTPLLLRKKPYPDRLRDDYFSCVKWSFGVLVVFLLSVTFSGYLFTRYTLTNISETYSSGTIQLGETDTTIRISLIGDSLINVPFKKFDMGAKLLENLPSTYSYQIFNHASNGRKIAAVAENLGDSLDVSPHAVILFWDTDCSDVDESTMTTDEVKLTRHDYISNLRYVINATIAAGTQYMAVSGPGLLGEGGPLGSYGIESKFVGKESMLDEYRDMTRTVSNSMGVEYLDMRAALFDAKPVWWFLNRWSVTIEGEHPSNLGASVEATLFGAALTTWLN